MKKIRLSRIPQIIALSAPFLLLGCQGMDLFGNNSSYSPGYGSNDSHSNKHSGTHQSQQANMPNKTSMPSDNNNMNTGKKNETTMMQPGVSTVNTPKAATTSAKSATYNTPTVTGGAPVVGQ